MTKATEIIHLFFRTGVIISLSFNSFCLKATEQQDPEPQSLETDHVLLRGLDKITARVFDLKIKIGQTTRLGTLDIIPRFCQKSLPEDPPEAKAYLEIFERSQHKTSQKDPLRVAVFSGWMFASSPAISALEHPVFDVWVISCTGNTVTTHSSVPEKEILTSSEASKVAIGKTTPLSPTLNGLKQGLSY